MQRVLKAKQKADRLARREQGLATPEFSEGLDQIKNEFDAMYQDDHTFMKQAGIMTQEEIDRAHAEQIKPLDL